MKGIYGMGRGTFTCWNRSSCIARHCVCFPYTSLAISTTLRVKSRRSFNLLELLQSIASVLQMHLMFNVVAKWKSDNREHLDDFLCHLRSYTCHKYMVYHIKKSNNKTLCLSLYIYFDRVLSYNTYFISIYITQQYGV